MNMLTNKVPFGLLSEDEQELFRDVNMNSMEVWLAGEWKQAFNLDSSHTYRLKLKEGEWYTGKRDDMCLPFTIQYTGERIGVFKEFRPATQAEIDSVKPQESFVDVEISWFKHHAVISHPFGFAEELHKVIKGHLIGGYVLVDYVIEDGVEQKILSNPIVTTYYDSDIRHIEKATHARFVRLEQ